MQRKKQKLDLEPVYIATTKLLLVKNPEQISFTLIARKTKIPRTTLYYYFDSKIENLIKESIRYSIKKMMQLWGESAAYQDSSFSSWEELQEHKFKEAIFMVLKEPWNLQLYFRYCRDTSEIGEEIRLIKDSYLQSTGQLWSQFQGGTLNENEKVLLSNIKLGILWGLMDPANGWREQPDKLAQVSTKLFSFILNYLSQKES